MIVNHLCTSLSGGASVAAQRLHQSLRTAGVDSRFWYSAREKKSPPDELANPIRWPAPANWLGMTNASVAWLRRKLSWNWAKYHHLRGRPEGYEIFTSARLATDTRYPADLSGEILHLHWIAKAIDYPSFFGSLPADLPIVWTLHDMNPFTGGCHFSSGCEGYLSGCGNCPQLAHRGENDLSHRQFLVKHSAVRDKNLHVVAPSQWLLDAARRSQILGSARSFRLIPYGLNLERFYPRDKESARKPFGVPADVVVFGFGADVVTNRRKGWNELLAALKQLQFHRPVVALVFGGGEIPALGDCRLTVMRVGFVNDPERLANLYSAMDFFVMPSLEDNLPQTGLEAMACGTPVVAFDAGGIPEFVVHEQTGLLAKTADHTDLARQIQRLLDHPDQLRSLGSCAGRLIGEQFPSHLEAARYSEFYRELLAERDRVQRPHAA